MAFRHRYTLICDDFRREDNGKLILIGVYVDTIVLPQLPFALPSISFFSFLESDRPGHWALDFKLTHLESGKNLVEGHGGAEVRKPGIVIAPLKFGPIQFQAVGAYSFSVQIQGEAEPIITHFNVQLNLSPSAV